MNKKQLDAKDGIETPMSNREFITKFMVKVNNWESLDKEEFIRDLLCWLTEKQLLVALNIAGVDFEDLKTKWLKGRNVQ